MSTSFNFIKYFLTGSSKPSPIYISSYSSPAREQNRRLQVNLQYHFYRRLISRDRHSKGSVPVDLPELGQHSRGQGAFPGDLCSSEAHLWFKPSTVSTVASCAWIFKSVLLRPPCHWWEPAEKSLTHILCPTISFSHSFFLLTSKFSSILWVGKGGKHTSFSHLIFLLFCTPHFPSSWLPPHSSIHGLKPLESVARSPLVSEVKVHSALLGWTPLSILVGTNGCGPNLCFHGGLKFMLVLPDAMPT